MIRESALVVFLVATAVTTTTDTLLVAVFNTVVFSTILLLILVTLLLIQATASATAVVGPKRFRTLLLCQYTIHIIYHTYHIRYQVPYNCGHYIPGIILGSTAISAGGCISG